MQIVFTQSSHNLLIDYKIFLLVLPENILSKDSSKVLICFLVNVFYYFVQFSVSL